MKNKKLQQKRRKEKKKITFPQNLNRDNLFSCPVWYADEPNFVDKLNTASDSYIDISKKNLKKDIDKRNKKYGDKGDMGHVFHSTSLIDDPNFLQLQNYIGATSYNLLGEMGFDLTNYQNLRQPRAH